MFIWEGVTQYISEEAVQRTLTFVGKSAPGSIIVFTYVLKSIIEHRSDIPDAEHMLATVAKTAPWVFGLDPTSLPAFLKPFHLALVADVGDSDYQASYLKPMGRIWPFLPVNASFRLPFGDIYLYRIPIYG